MSGEKGRIRLSVVAPAHNEAENVGPLVAEIEAALDPTGVGYEIVIVDDGSTDGTGPNLRALQNGHSSLRVVHLPGTNAGKGSGQSAALYAGFRAARGLLIATLDADLQNDPADLPGMLSDLRETGVDLIQGDRTGSRTDGLWRRFDAWVGRVFRRILLADRTRDSGCGLRVMRREVALALPLDYRGMHRFIPVLARQSGYRVSEMPVRHRPRGSGRTHYGTWDRATAGLHDCLAVRWMGLRRRSVASDPAQGHGSGSTVLDP
jgi:glycosyltransferase involved in cell wall biosynthesis